MESEPTSTPPPEQVATPRPRAAARAFKVWEKVQPALPWLSVVYGIASGFAIERDYAKSQRLLLLGIGTIVFIIFLAQLERLRRRHEATANEKWQKHMPRLVFAGNWLTQSCVQYISLFVLPLTFFNKSYVHMIVACLCATVAIVDQFWQRAVRWPFFLPLVRAISGYFALSFSLPTLAPKLLPYYATIVDMALILLFIPWSLLEQWWDLTWQRRLLWLICISFPLGNLFIPLLPGPVLLSVWVKDLSFGYNVTDHALRQTLGEGVAQQELATHLQNGDKLCCYTPIMGPVGLEPSIVHEWYADDALIDRIQLGPVSGRSSMNEPGFRTFSCKATFPNLGMVSSLRCRVLLGQGAIIGEGKLEVMH